MESIKFKHGHTTYTMTFTPTGYTIYPLPEKPSLLRAVLYEAKKSLQASNDSLDIPDEPTHDYVAVAVQAFLGRANEIQSRKYPDDTRHITVNFLQPQNCTIDIIQNVKKPDDTYEAQTVESVTLRYEHIGYELDSPQMWHIAYRNKDACYYDNFKTEEPAVQFLRAFVNGMTAL